MDSPFCSIPLQKGWNIIFFFFPYCDIASLYPAWGSPSPSGDQVTHPGLYNNIHREDIDFSYLWGPHYHSLQSSSLLALD